jgi:hypothetical protein
MRSQRWSVVGGLVLLAAPVFAGPDKVHAGQWEITSQMTITGMPFQPPPATRTQCITRKDVVPRPPAAQGNCEISAVKEDAGKFSWHVKCTGERAAEGNGEIAYSGDTMEGHATFNMTNPRTGQPIEAQQTIKGRRLGDCPATK